MILKPVSLFAATFVVIGTSAFAQVGPDNHAAPGTIAPDSVRVLPNGEVAPAPARRSNGGVGATEVGNDNAQTRSGGPSGGFGTRN